MTQPEKKTPKTKILFPVITILLLLLCGAGVYIALIHFEKSSPSLELTGDIKYLGKKETLNFSAQDKGLGLRSLRLVIKQNNNEYVLYDEIFPRASITGKMGPQSITESVDFDYSASKLNNGEATIILSATDYSLKNGFSGNHEELQYTVNIDTVPPKISIIHAEKYISNGGSGLVIYQLSGDHSRHGVEISGHFHPGHQAGLERDDVYLAYIALPYDTEEIGESLVLAEDYAGNRSIYPFSSVFKKKAKKLDRINITDGFLKAKIPEFSQHYPDLEGGMREKYLHANSSIRLANNAKIAQLCQDSVSEKLWDGRFIRMAGATKAGFAEYRTYYYNGKEIDRQVHLGIDIASTRRAEVKAANGGRVVFADYLGIYGNMVLLDHGQGIFSLYSHLSRIDVAVDDEIRQGVVLGLTGKTGMAGGDHLHFSMLVNGVFVMPLEWWDQNWIDVTINAPLNDARF